MGFGWSGAGAGAANALEQILAQQLLTAQAKQREQETAKRLQMDETRLNAQLADAEDDRKFRTRQEDRIAAGDRDKNNRLGVRRMIGESLMQRTGPMTPEDRRSIAALQVEAGDLPDMSLLTEPKPQRFSVTTRGANGAPLRKLVTEDELAAGVEEYREPKEPRQGPQPDYEWITRNGTPMQIRKGTAQPGDRPYEKAAATTNGPNPEKAAETRAKILDAAKGLRDSKGVKSMTGARGMSYGFGLSGDNPVPGTDAASAKARFDTLKSLMTLENLGLLKGAMSDKDLAFIQSAGSAINTAMDDNTFAAELDKIIRTFESPSAAAPAAGGGMPTLVFNPATGKLESVKP